MKNNYVPPPQHVSIANKTNRSTGAIGPRALVPRIFVKLFEPTDDLQVLDYGAGADAMHTIYLRSLRYNVTAHEFGANITEMHDPNALGKQYGIVIASNVLNVQSTEVMLMWSLKQICSVLKPGGQLLCNYPKEPRKLKLGVSCVKACLSSVFKGDVQDVGGRTYAPVMLVTKNDL